MGALPYIVGGGLVLLVVAAAGKAKASTASSSTSSSTTKPTGSTTTKPTTTTASTSVPLTIINQILATADRDAAQRQRVWLTDNGYPQTGFALVQWLKGEITDEQLRQVAAQEKATHVAGTGTAKPTGVMTTDNDGLYYLTNGTNDELYDYAVTSNSIPLVAQAATRLAAAGDTRATVLTQHLADIST